MSQMVDVPLRVSPEVAALVRCIEEAGTGLLLQAHILLDDAKHAQTLTKSLGLLIEREYLHGLVSDFIATKHELRAEAARLGYEP